MRKLASIQKVLKLEKVEELDNLLLAEIEGWRCLVKKDEFQVGDLGVFFEVDSVLPEKPEYEFLRAKKFRIKTMKLKGVISQGLFMPTSILPVGLYREGQDVTELLGVVKYEVQENLHLAWDCKSTFPEFIFKTDEERIQNCKNILIRNPQTPVVVTEKLDGTSATFYLKDGQFGVCSRNQELKNSENSVYWNIARKYDIEKYLKGWGKNIAIQGEIIGPKIQKNKYKLTELRFYVFSVQDLDTRTYFKYWDMVKLLSDDFGKILQIVPLTLPANIIIDDPTVDNLVEMSKGKSLINPDIIREGLVIRSIDNKFDSYLGRISFKVINPEFLLKYE